MLTGCRCDGPTSRTASRERHGSQTVVGDDVVNEIGGNQQRLEDTVGVAGFVKNILDGFGTAGDIRGVFQEADVAHSQVRRGEPEDLPEGKVPWHDCENRAERFVDSLDARVGRTGVALWLEILAGRLGVVVTDPRALLDFGDGLSDGFTHLSGHRLGVLLFVLAEDFSCALEQLFAFPERTIPPLLEGCRGLIKRTVNVVFRMSFVRFDPFTGRRIDDVHAVELCLKPVNPITTLARLRMT